MAQLKPISGDEYLWRYVPSRAAAIVFVVFFAIPTGFVIWRIVKTRSWHCIPFAIGGLFEMTGYSARAAAQGLTDVMMPYFIQHASILLAPALFSAAMYMTLVRMMRRLKGQRHSIIPVTWLPVIFVAGDAVSFCIQGSGAGVVATGLSSMETGQKIIAGGISLQIVMFGLFIATSIVFHIGLRHWPSGPSLARGSTWKRSMKVLYVTSVLIVARSTFRLAESILGPDGYPQGHEWTLYVFDGLPMLCVMGIFTGWFPGAEGGRGSHGDDGGWQLETMDAWPSYESPT
ncbi:hypothetical protein CEP54_003776 [Fusarium duplospermum]|uniref:Uncharacterized protein n=1 Tax=Fusarium duplospermum TaxID=1325734 RepID=A0A428QM03_9HYPO|nr:hypothetical protein CEP54_003776 [Fusarium duplospermum]